MADLKSMLKEVTAKMVKAQTPKPESVKNAIRMAEAAKTVSKTPKE